MSQYFFSFINNLYIRYGIVVSILSIVYTEASTLGPTIWNWRSSFALVLLSLCVSVAECVVKLISHRHINLALSIFKLNSILIECTVRSFLSLLLFPSFWTFWALISMARKRYYHFLSSLKPFFVFLHLFPSSMSLLFSLFSFVLSIKSWLESSDFI